MWSRIVIFPWSVIFSLLFFYLLMAVGATVDKSLKLDALTIQQGRAAAIYQYGTDPSTGEEAAQVLADMISHIVPVEQTDITHSAFPRQPDTIGLRELAVNVNYYDGSHVTTTMVYGMPLPVGGLLNWFGYQQTTPIPLVMQVSFYREW